MAKILNHSPYHYTPTKSVAYAFVTLFGISTFLHLGQAIYYSLWWLLPTVCLAGVLEVVGWTARLWSSYSVYRLTPFQIQITATIIGPTPLIAANFIILGRIIDRLGPSFSRLKPRWYSIVFCSCDVISLVVQAIGGAMASSAVSHGNDPSRGGHIMLGGIVFQLITITIYALLAFEFFIRYVKDWEVRREGVATNGARRGSVDRRLLLMICALGFSTLLLFIRSVYRTIELTNGWDGPIISTEKYFNILDGGMVSVAFYTINLAHPGYLLAYSKEHWGSEGKGEQTRSEMMA